MIMTNGLYLHIFSKHFEQNRVIQKLLYSDISCAITAWTSGTECMDAADSTYYRDRCCQAEGIQGGQRVQP